MIKFEIDGKTVFEGELDFSRFANMTIKEIADIIQNKRNLKKRIKERYCNGGSFADWQALLRDVVSYAHDCGSEAYHMNVTGRYKADCFKKLGIDE